MMTQLVEGYSAAEAARRLSLTPNMVRVLMTQGKLAYIQTSIGRLVVPEAVSYTHLTLPTKRIV